MSLPLASLPTWILSSAATRSHQILHRHLAEAGVDGYAYRCLAALASAGQLSQSELGHAAALDPRDVTHTVRALEDRGLVSREKDPGHGRRVLVSLTDEGSRAADRLSRVMDDVQAEVFGRLSREERSTLLRLLERVAV
ncbi:MarR family transcriptional regulator [uncultured Reyranella sp.]|uniref:MarR family winged helix-turn-helix transcriptional regulator n=1 Tax=uncultured Reyranella sp. TaxID=735512 RepID=UPI0025F99AEE|nr:MarR family transcriptional regulator [uncultured Reyranella sp.]